MIKINLLRDYSPQTGALFTPEKSQIGIYAAILFLVIFGGMGWWYWHLLDTRAESAITREELQQERLRLQAIKAQLEKYESQKKALDHRIAVIERLKANQKGPVLLMNGIIASIPDRPTLWLSTLVQKDKVLTIEGRSFDIPSIADFIANLNQQTPFKRVELGDLQAEEERFKFTLSCELGN